MGVRRPKQPSTPLPKGAKRVKAAEPTVTNVSDVVYNPPSRKRAKDISQTQTPQTRSVGHRGFVAHPPAIRAVRGRGSSLGRLKPEATEELAEELGWAPQIDPSPSTQPLRPRTLQLGYVKERGAPTGTVRVRFRDGTPWDYYDVPPNVWRNLRRVKSPGRFINRVLNNFDYGRGDW